MCTSERCCYVVPANLGCVLMGIMSFILSLFTLATSITFFIIESKHDLQKSGERTHFGRSFGLDLNLSSIHIILSIAIIVALLWMLFSIMLVIGIIQNRSNLILCYFSFGIIVTIICQLISLLVLLANSWILSLVLFILSLIHIHGLVVVHTVYDLMSKGKDFRFRQHEDDEDLLADCFDGDTSRV